MSSLSVKNISRIEYILTAILLLGVVALGVFSYQQYQEIIALEKTEQDLSTTLTETRLALETASSTVETLEQRLLELGEDLEDLADDYDDERNRNEEFQDQIRDLGATVKVLDKLSKTDEELLQKYSRVYFLNENYIPESIREIDNEWKYNEAKEIKLHSAVIPYFEDMVEDAKDDGINLWAVSGYRSFEQQAVLKGQYLATYGSGANAFSADQGYSEHQLGTTVDFTTNGLGGGLNGFGNTPAFAWLEENAHEYGFTLSYAEGNAFYEYEPWHWRFVGEDLAKDLHRADAHFYDWDQRKIDTYLISIFD